MSIRILSLKTRALARERRQPADDRVENRVDPKEEERKDRRHDQHHDRRLHRFAARRPDDLARFGAHLIDELSRAGLGHVDRPVLATSMIRARWVAAAHASSTLWASVRPPSPRMSAKGGRKTAHLSE